MTNIEENEDQSSLQLPQPQIEPVAISFDQFAAFIPRRLELYRGYIGIREDRANFYATVLANMGLIGAIESAKAPLWAETLKTYLLMKIELPEVAGIAPEEKTQMIDRLNRAIEDITEIAKRIDSTSS